MLLLKNSLIDHTCRIWWIFARLLNLIYIMTVVCRSLFHCRPACSVLTMYSHTPSTLLHDTQFTLDDRDPQNPARERNPKGKQGRKLAKGFGASASRSEENGGCSCKAGWAEERTESIEQGTVGRPAETRGCSKEVGHNLPFSCARANCIVPPKD